MRRKVVKFVFLAFAFLILTAFASVSEAKTIYVPDDYEKIQWAVDNATAGDTIVVRDGTYVENIDINKPHLTIKSENGSANCVVKAANSNDPVFYVNADNVTIKGFTVTGATGYYYGYYYPKAGIYLYNSNYSRIEDVNASDNSHGIYLRYSNNNIITNNNISSNNYDGIHLYDSSNNIITNNNISNNDDGIDLDSSSNSIITNNNILNNDDGIDLDYSNNNTITNNIVSNNDNGIYLRYSNNNTITNNNASLNYWDGIYLDSSSNNIITNNIVSNNYDGIYLWSLSNNNTIANNNILNNDDGIYLDSSNNIITNNIVSNNGYGISLYDSSNNIITNNNISLNYWDGIIFLHYSSNNIITNNNISSNNYDGICLWYSSNNIIYLNNFVNNIKDNVYSSSSTNIWNSTSKITYTYNGKTYTNYLGNYWSDYTGSDADGDGIGDTPYSIDEDRDNYPLMKRFENYIVTPVPNQLPIANFTYSPEKPVVNQSVTFDASSSYDPDGKIIAYEWDFGDGNITNTTEEVIKHSYSEAGSYEVVLTVTDDKGAKNSTTKMVTVMPAPPSVSISTDKYEYTAGDVMLINITITNPSERKGVKFLWRLDISDYNLSFKVINNKSLLLPPEFKKTFVIPWRLPKLSASFNASWYVALYSDGVISEDTADWRYIGAKKKGRGEREIAREMAEYLREIERSVFLACE